MLDDHVLGVVPSELEKFSELYSTEIEAHLFYFQSGNCCIQS